MPIIPKELKKYIIFLEKTLGVKRTFKIKYVKTRKEMDALANRKTENFVVGFASQGNVFIFPKKLFPKFSPHPESHFDEVLKHEIAHLYIHKAFGRGPAWFDEGLACVLAGQNKKLPKKLPDPTKLISREDFRKEKQAYPKSMKLVLNLIDQIKNEQNKKSD